MSSSNATLREARAQGVAVTGDTLAVDLVDGRTISAPLAWYPRLLNGTRAERDNWRLIADGEGIHWPDLDEDLSVESLIAGRPSGESPESLRHWLETRGARTKRMRSPVAARSYTTKPPAIRKARAK
jgi:hypothetical protein